MKTDSKHREHKLGQWRLRIATVAHSMHEESIMYTLDETLKKALIFECAHLMLSNLQKGLKEKKNLENIF